MRTMIVLASVMALGCAGRGSPVAVQGPAMDVEHLVGRWAGEFHGDNGRAGTIHFELAAAGDTAWGDVLMQAFEPPLHAEPDPRPTNAPVTTARSIRFVRVAGARVRGMLAPDRDPVCGCQVQTTFEGALRGDVIEGEYVSRHLEHAFEVRGTWRVQRLPSR